MRLDILDKAEVGPVSLLLMQIIPPPITLIVESVNSVAIIFLILLSSLVYLFIIYVIIINSLYRSGSLIYLTLESVIHYVKPCPDSE